MSFNELYKKIIGDVKWKDLDHKKVYMALAALVVVIVLIIVLIAGAVSKKGTKVSGDEIAVAEEAVETVEEAEAEGNPLEVDAYDEINRLALVYFHGLSTGDIPMVEEAVDVLTEEEIKTIEKKKDYIESYNDITCYTKKGPEEDSFVVFASYEMKIYNIETPAPGIMALYVTKGADGEYRIFNGEASEELTSYVLELAAGEDVAAVIADVDARYNQLIKEDEELGKFAQTILESQMQADAEDTGEVAEAADGEVKELEEPIETTVNDGIRLREGRSTETRVLGGIANGTKVKVYANYSDGWSKIEYNGSIGHCMTEFLASTEGVPMINVDAEEAEAEEEAEAPAANDEAETTAVNKQMKFGETVRIRKEASVESDRISTGYEGDSVKVLENRNDGWSKIEYKNVTGYCKTEYLTEAE
ncbi:MAG: SH3 domain-containing protein [Lachnospiraceae bacterium]|nr:SH3 domain-containing protein [Lachnospiraceae bacterium]